MRYERPGGGRTFGVACGAAIDVCGLVRTHETSKSVARLGGVEPHEPPTGVVTTPGLVVTLKEKKSEKVRTVQCQVPAWHTGHKGCGGGPVRQKDAIMKRGKL